MVKAQRWTLLKKVVVDGLFMKLNVGMITSIYVLEAHSGGQRKIALYHSRLSQKVALTAHSTAGWMSTAIPRYWRK